MARCKANILDAFSYGNLYLPLSPSQYWLPGSFIEYNLMERPKILSQPQPKPINVLL